MMRVVYFRHMAVESGSWRDSANPHPDEQRSMLRWKSMEKSGVNARMAELR